MSKTEIASRDMHGGQARIKAARFPSRKTIEELGFAFQTSLRRHTVLHLAQLDFLAGRENIVLLGCRRRRGTPRRRHASAR